MNIVQMHTAIDVGVNHLNSNSYRKIPKEVKDSLISNISIEFILKAVNDIGSSLLMPSTRDEMKAISTNLRTLYTNIDLPKLPDEDFTDGNFATFEIPSFTTGSITSGLIRHQTRYRFITVGSTDWTGIFPGSPSNGDEVVSNLSILDSTSGDISIIEGVTYKVIQKGTYSNWESIGYSTNEIRKGVVIKATTNDTILSGTNVKLQPLTAFPTWVSSELYMIDNYNMLAYQSINATISLREFSKGRVKIGSYLIVDAQSGDDFTSIGGTSISTTGDIITCASETNVNFTNGSKIAKIIYVPCLITTKELSANLQLNDSYTSSTAPLAVISNNEIYIYHSEHFKIRNANLTYIRTPRRVNLDYGISSDINEVTHPSIIDAVVSRIIANVKGENYQAVKTEQSVEQKTHRL
jgi:hypothetical protein